MDSTAMQLMAEQLGLGQEEVKALQSGDVASLLASRMATGSRDSLTPLLMASAIRQRSQAAADEEQTAAQLSDALERAKQIVAELKDHLAHADMMIAHLAETFGACPVCWGGSERCQRCRGTGKPGSSPPVEHELLEWITPALTRLDLEIVRRDK